MQSWPGGRALRAQFEHQALVGLLSPNSSHRMVQVLPGELGSHGVEGTPHLDKP